MTGPLRGLALALAVALGAGPAGAARAECRLALAMALDVSGSVNGTEYRLQLDGLAGALLHPDVTEAILAIPGTSVAIMVYEWSGPRFQRVLLDWTEMSEPGHILSVTQSLGAVERERTEPSTAIGSSMMFGAAALDRGPQCYRRVIDISGDGKSNNGPNPRDAVLADDIMVNALVIGGELIDPAELRHVTMAELSAYFRAYVIRGAEAFVETANGFRDFEDAMVRKLMRELQVLAVSEADRTAD